MCVIGFSETLRHTMSRGTRGRRYESRGSGRTKVHHHRYEADEFNVTRMSEDECFFKRPYR
ncbi:hypothetical protein EYF80_022671 [Liparis tanakae]|uniref:Uncharacterized protein n=1 Tax=Liparis tanakae TaxID=230148 RepID=A0A4Z2HNL0_9TELE|nr:hypothetical protein EYF80_022671 [Liparis tanakae]